MQWVHGDKNPIDQVAFLQRIVLVPASYIVDIDGMVQNHNDFYSKYGWSPIGQQCVRQQITIDGQTYAVHAAFTELGFIIDGWRIFTGTVTDKEISDFIISLKNKLPAIV